MTVPMTARRTVARTTAVVALTAAILVPGVASAQAAAAPAPSAASGDSLTGLLGQATGILSNILDGSALIGSPSSILPTGVLGG
ncbi:hypothetical protein QF030_007914 [Streptomyces rishiriensis]|uniref:Secreted protein n=1 Tax=Streptomyces rishiriensis TaxID=68264 RepID=A0ABU0P2W4_STRRH|nr:hypothetical protein [Streptomyces rishiriensis]